MKGVDWLAAAFVGALMFLALCAAAGIFGGVTDDSWLRDCDAIGKHVVDGKVYVCHAELPAASEQEGQG